MKYTSERNTQILIGLLKYHGIKKIIASPGANNVSFVASVQSDPFFEVYSAVDERSAAYMACGMAAESGETIVLTCTGATASRNYFPGLTEAYYRHLPILAITYTLPVMKIGHNLPQVIDRSVLSNDIAKLSVTISMINNTNDEWNCNININKAILEVNHGNVGPVHINIETLQGGDFNSDVLPDCKPIDRFLISDQFPTAKGKIAIFVGAHSRWTMKFQKSVDEFCEKYNAVVICDHTSNYKGKYKYNAALSSVQSTYFSECLKVDILIHIGDISGAYYKIKPFEVWRVNKEGDFCDTYGQLRYIFEMEELEFFVKMNSLAENNGECTYYEECQNEEIKLKGRIPELPFSNIWIAQKMCDKLPNNCVLHLGILNSLRSWNFFEISEDIDVFSNTGGFGIDGCMSTVLGASLVSKDKLFFCVLGDLAFFYDLNALGNRHFGNNIRIMMINNGKGQEFKNYGHRAAQFGDDTDDFIAAAGHFGNKSNELVKNIALNLGFEYMTANDKKSALECINRFTTNEELEKPLIFEVFTDSSDETEALRILSSLETSLIGGAKSIVKNILGEKGVDNIKKLIKNN